VERVGVLLERLPVGRGERRGGRRGAVPAADAGLGRPVADEHGSVLPDASRGMVRRSAAILSTVHRSFPRLPRSTIEGSTFEASTFQS
jgi:hypothetical protein